MSQHLEAQNKLSQFAPLSPEDRRGGVGYLFTNFFRKVSAAGATEDDSTSQGPTSDAERTVGSTKHEDWEVVENTTHATVGSTGVDVGGSDLYASYKGVQEGRSLPNVLKRVSNLLALRKSGAEGYKESDLRQYWMPDSVSKECYDCGDKFTTFRRRHHCRVCGQIFCARCCGQEIPGHIMGSTGDLRVCTYCCKVVLSYLRSSDMEADLSADLRSVQEGLQQAVASAAVSPVGSSHAPSPGKQTLSSPPQQHGASVVERGTGARRSLYRRKQSFQEDRFLAASAVRRGGGLSSPGPYLNSEQESPAESEDSLREVWAALRSPQGGIELQTHRYLLRTFPSCFLGSELVDWLLAHNRATTMPQAASVGQALMDAGLLEGVSHPEPVFQDGYSLYRPRTQDLAVTPATGEGRGWQDPLGVATFSTEVVATERRCGEAGVPPSPSSSTYCLELDVHESRAQLRSNTQPSDSTDSLAGSSAASSNADITSEGRSGSRGGGASFPALATTGITHDFLARTLLAAGRQEMTPSLGWHTAHHLRRDNGELEAYTRLSESFGEHSAALLLQQLQAEGVPQSWATTLAPLARQVAELVRPDVRGEADDMDIRQYVQVKQVSGGSRAECHVVSGVVCTKTVAHRAMANQLANPRILLLGCSVIYERVEGRLVSMDPLIMQEQEYLRNAVARIVSLQPDLVLVERSVSRLAQDMLLEHGVTLVLNVKPSVMERVARLTQADIVTCIDAHVGRPRLGMCHNFFLQTLTLHDGRSKTLMFLEGCATHLGCTVLLRGGPTAELQRLKRVFTLLVLVHYNWRLENSFLMDEFAMPPPPQRDDDFLETPAQMEEEEEEQTSVEQAVNMPEELHADTTLRTSEKPSDGVAISSEKHTAASMRLCKSRSNSTECREAVAEDPLSVPPSPQLQQQHESHQQRPAEVTSPSEGSSVCAVELPLGSGSGRRLKEALEGAALSASPLLQARVVFLGRFHGSLSALQVPLPYLETEAGRTCALRRFFPEQLFWSPHLDPGADMHARCAAGRSEEVASDPVTSAQNGAVFLEVEQPLARARLTRCADSWEVQAALAQFRARGSRLPHPQLQPQTSQARKSACQARPAQQPQPAQREAADVTAARSSRVDALNAANHQRLIVLFCSFSPESHNAPAFCVNPWVVHMELCGRNDIPLGQFLQQYCFNPSYACPSPSCHTPMARHVRRFVHGGGCVQMTLKQLESAIPVDGSAILSWTWCQKCEQVSPVVPLSLDAWSLSLAKYLELRFYGRAYMRRGEAGCSHSLHQEHVQYFGYRDVIATFQYLPVEQWEVSLPTPRLSRLVGLVAGAACSVALRRADVIEQVKLLAWQAHDTFSLVLEKLCHLPAKQDVSVPAVSALKQQLTQEHATFKQGIEEVQLRLTCPPEPAEGHPEASQVPQGASGAEAGTGDPPKDRRWWRSEEPGALRRVWELEDRLVQLRRALAEAVAAWNVRLGELVRRGEERPPTKRPIGEPSRAGTSQEGGVLREAELSGTVDSSSLESTRAHGGSLADLQALAVSAELNTVSEDLSGSSPETRASRSHERSRSDGDSRVAGCSTERSATPQPTQPPQGSATVKQIISQLLPSTSTAQILVPSPLAAHEHYLPRPLAGAPDLAVLETEPSSVIAHALCSQDYRARLVSLTESKPRVTDQPLPSPKETRRKAQQTPPHTEPAVTASEPPSGSSETGARRTVLSFLRGGTSSSSSSTTATTAAPTPATFQGVQYIAGSSSTADEAEPSSSDVPSDCEEGRSAKSASRASAASLLSQDNQGSECATLDVYFQDAVTAFQVRVFLADQFAALRALVWPEGEESFARSLARCLPWAARGGKSGSAFCKTKDDRLVLKEMTQNEVTLFLALAPAYLAHVCGALENGQPTLLGKILGVYRVACRSLVGAAAPAKTHFLVMENLFFGRTIAQRFDLKGSMRNRLVDAPQGGLGSEDIVLLDENLLRMTCESPLYIQPHAKEVLTLAIERDTRFLASQAVMDYSLLVGLDTERRELVLGIIDYVRTFTWDKRLENMVKSMGGQGKLPTIVHPEVYRARFIAAMHRYFLPVPDRWTSLGRGVDC